MLSCIFFFSPVSTVYNLNDINSVIFITVLRKKNIPSDAVSVLCNAHLLFKGCKTATLKLVGVQGRQGDDFFNT